MYQNSTYKRDYNAKTLGPWDFPIRGGITGTPENGAWLSTTHSFSCKTA